MKISIELALKTREANRLFDIKINGDRLFINAVLHKLNRVNSKSMSSSTALARYIQIEKAMMTVASQFTQEAASFSIMLDKNQDINTKSILVIAQFHPKIIATNRLDLLLVKLIESFDTLVATINLLHLAACFDSDGAYYANLMRVKKIGHRVLSSILLLSDIKNIHHSNFQLKPLHSITVQPVYPEKNALSSKDDYS